MKNFGIFPLSRHRILRTRIFTRKLEKKEVECKVVFGLFGSFLSIIEDREKLRIVSENSRPRREKIQ